MISPLFLGLINNSSSQNPPSWTGGYLIFPVKVWGCREVQGTGCWALLARSLMGDILVTTLCPGARSQGHQNSWLRPECSIPGCCDNCRTYLPVCHPGSLDGLPWHPIHTAFHPLTPYQHCLMHVWHLLLLCSRQLKQVGSCVFFPGCVWHFMLYRVFSNLCLITLGGELGRSSHSHFTNKETEAQIGQVIDPRQHR